MFNKKRRKIKRKSVSKELLRKTLNVNLQPAHTHAYGTPTPYTHKRLDINTDVHMPPLHKTQTQVPHKLTRTDCICVCTYMLMQMCTCVCTYKCASQRSAIDIFLNCFATRYFIEHLSSKPHGSSCLCFLHAQNTSSQCHMGTRGLNSSLHACAIDSLPTVLFPQPQTESFFVTLIIFVKDSWLPVWAVIWDSPLYGIETCCMFKRQSAQSLLSWKRFCIGSTFLSQLYQLLFWVSSGKLLNLFTPQFPHLWNWDHILRGLLWNHA